MSYFQKYQRGVANSRTSSFSNDSNLTDRLSRPEFGKNTDSRQSYLKAFKKYYIDKLMEERVGKSQQENQPTNSQNFYFNDTPLKERSPNISLHTKSCKDPQSYKMTPPKQKRESTQADSRLNRSKMVALVNNKDNEIEQLLYSSISQVQKQIMKIQAPNDLARENQQLKSSIDKLKRLLKEKLEMALKRNKQQFSLMFDQYSNMIKKLLQDKEKLTTELEKLKLKLTEEEHFKRTMEQQYQNKIRIIIEDNNAQIGTTKQQVEEFLDMIVQYEEEANAEKEELQKLREKVIDLEMENDNLKKQAQNSSQQSASASNTQGMSEGFNHSGPVQDLERYAEKIQSLLQIVERLSEENEELNMFLKSCKCSKIKNVKDSNASLSQDNEQEVLKSYEHKIIELQKDFIREQMLLREAMRRKDQCIDRLNLVIQQMRKGRYESVDRLTQQALSRQSSKHT